jgi:hypothetical protein
VPIVPVVVLNIDAMHAVTNWIPGQRTIIHTIVGEPIVPASSHDRIGRRQRRAAMTAALAKAFIDLHIEGQTIAGGHR